MMNRFNIDSYSHINIEHRAPNVMFKSETSPTNDLFTPKANKQQTKANITAEGSTKVHFSELVSHEITV